jgi:thiamine-phosphate pyrophosphorylase
MVQLRLKNAGGRRLVEVGRALVASLGVPVVVNDRVDVALACGAAGAHLGASDLPIADARRIVPRAHSWRSITVEADLANARSATTWASGRVSNLVQARRGRGTGEALFADFRRRAALPAVAIGGVTARNVPSSTASGLPAWL